MTLSTVKSRVTEIQRCKHGVSTHGQGGRVYVKYVLALVQK